MKNLFKKATSTSSGDPIRTPKKNKQSILSRKKKSSSTPPVTPSPTKDGSNISVRVIPSQKLSFSLYHDKSTAGTAAEVDPRNHPQLGTTTLPNSIQSLGPSTFSDESSLFDTVLGFGCGPKVHLLSTIPEENAEWGIPPFFAEDEDDADSSFDGHDDFEVVLEQNQFGAENDDDMSDVPMFCRPCETDIVGRARRGNGNGNGNVSEQHNAEKKKRRFKMPKMKGDKSKKSKDKKAIVADAGRNGKDDTSSNGSGSGSAVSSPKRKNRSQKNKDHKVRKEFSLKNMQIGKQFHSKFHKKKARDEPKDGTGAGNVLLTTMPSRKMPQKPKRGRWKCVHDDASNRVYYYHTLTRKVSWDRPSGFVEWRVSHDMNQRQFFYNVISKETMWETPDDFVVWKEVKDPKSGNAYYYNVLNKETTWEKPSDFKDNAVSGGSSSTSASASAKMSIVKDGGSAPNGDVIKAKANNEHAAKAQSANNSHAQTAKDAPISKPSSTTNDENLGIIADLVRVESELSSALGGIMEEPPKIVKTENDVRLAKLLHTYCPNEKDNNDQLMDKCRGQETSVIKAIERLIDETPFDELRLAIFSYVKSTLRAMGEEPFDERKNVWKRNNSKASFAVPSPRRMKKVDTYATSASTAGYSMNSRALSHVTEQTNRIRNTSSRLLGGNVPAESSKESLVELNEKWQNLSLDNSAEYLTDVTDDENQKQVVLDMKIVPVQLKEAVVREPENTEAQKVSESMENKVEAKKEMTSSAKEEVKEKLLITPFALVAEKLMNSSNDAMTLESAYAADNDGEADEWEEEDADAVSALSDSFGPSMMKRYMKEKKILTEKEESLRKKKVRTLRIIYSCEFVEI